MKYSIKIATTCLFIILLNSCNSKGEHKTPGTSILSQYTKPTDSTLPSNAPKADTLPNGSYYYYEPDFAKVKGILKTELYFGATGNKEYFYFIYLNYPINVIQKSSHPDDWNDRTVKNIYRLQLFSNLDLKPLLNKKIEVTGSFFHSATVHHHTPVLMDVIRAEDLTPEVIELGDYGGYSKRNAARINADRIMIIKNKDPRLNDTLITMNKGAYSTLRKKYLKED